MRRLPKEILNILNLINKNGYEAYVVGGASRDFLLHKNIYDVDINTNASSKIIKEIFKDYKQYDIGKSLGTISIIIKNYKLDITPYRKEGPYTNHRRPDNVSFNSNLEEDLKRRDFTINALCIDSNMNIIDYYYGLMDLSSKKIKAIGKPEERFNEDALRILRAIRFKAQLSFKIEKNTKNAILNCKELLRSISSERKKDELLKTLSFDKSYSLIKEYKEVFNTFIEFKHINKKIDNFTNPLYKISYMIDLDELANLKALTFSKNELDLIELLIISKKTNINNNYEFNKLLSNKKYFDDIVKFLNELHGINLKEKIKNNKKYFTDTNSLAIKGEELINLGYKGKEISKIKNELIREIQSMNIKNTKSSIKNYLLSK